nr:unnamed protein product [Digitaria exilis]
MSAEADTGKLGAGGETLSVHLPPLSEEDPLHQDKKTLKLLDQMVQAARVVHMDKLELYFAGDDDIGPFSARNETESLNLLFKTMNKLLLTSNAVVKEVLQMLKDEIVVRLRSVGKTDGEQMISETQNHDAEDSLLKWGEHHGVKSKLQIAYVLLDNIYLIPEILVFQGAGRGMVASENIGVEDTALEIPESLIISEEILCQTEVFLALKDFHNISSETMLLLWSMRERYNLTSKFKQYFETLPANFNTGLSFGIDALAALEGTLLFDEIMQAKQVISLYYSSDLFLMFSFSYLLKVSPHILNYGRVDEATKSLKFPLSRPCDAGEQCFLSYGKHPGSHLVTFYGFLPRGDNPYDVIHLDLDTSVDEEDGTAQSVSTSQTTHMVRGTWLSRSGGFPTYGLPQPLLSHLRAALGCDLDESTTEADMKEIDRVVLETLLSIFNPMLKELPEPEESERESANWDVKLALDYKDLQRRIISSIVTSCTSALENV